MVKKHRLTFVLPLDLWKRLKALAAKNQRSATKEIIVAILEHLEREG